jgi:hypothetical protein
MFIPLITDHLKDHLKGHHLSSEDLKPENVMLDAQGPRDPG